MILIRNTYACNPAIAAKDELHLAKLMGQRVIAEQLSRGFRPGAKPNGKCGPILAAKKDRAEPTDATMHGIRATLMQRPLTARSIQEKLKLSRGTVNEALRLLHGRGAIRFTMIKNPRGQDSRVWRLA